MNETDTFSMLPSAFVSETSVTIRPFVREDISAIRDMATRIWREHYVPEIVTAEQIEYMLPLLYSDKVLLDNVEQKKQRIWLLFSNEILAGYIAAEPNGTGGWFIDKLYVGMAIQRRGLGAMLLNHIISELKPREISLRVNKRNYKAINFYFQHGFVIAGMQCLDIGGGYVMDDFLMHKIL